MEEDCHPHLYAGVCVCFVCIDGYFTLVPAIVCSEVGMINPTLATSVRGRFNCKPDWDVAFKSGSGALETQLGTKINMTPTRMVKSKFTGKPTEKGTTKWRNQMKPKNKITLRIIPLVNGDPKLTHAATVEVWCVILGHRGAPESAAVPLPRINSKAVPSHSICRHSRKPTPRGSRKRFKNNRTSPVSTRFEIAYSRQNYDQSAATYDWLYKMRPP